jgi:hypothetical protein
MKATRILILSAVGVVAVLGAEPSEAATRWRVDGNVCHGYIHQLPESEYGWVWPRSDGIEFKNTGGLGGVICPLPVGDAVVNTTAAPLLMSVGIRVQQTAPGAIIDSYLVLNDADSSSACTCGHDRITINSGYAGLSMPFDCGSCSFTSTWPANIRINGSHNGVIGGFTKVKRITVASN